MNLTSFGRDCESVCLTHVGDFAVVVDEERPSIGAILISHPGGRKIWFALCWDFGWAVGRRLRGLRVGKRVLYGSPYLGVIGSLQKETEPTLICPLFARLYYLVLQLLCIIH